ncbi:hypothetical protein F5B22DRAFT_658714 [Xylaria bambusicola]|uniref:uncharacterized protein n=1 Tax=Xylaria bambusicola TaxID=326684 RepID=UPI002007935D|nr:uncharacterized protein F5B22DRAFT_658714 [Xylaria bambusicola]KAI0508923.1 hypothetical protein F5B22DRAFT_658714 [Xylaria bambusicola]
MRPPSSTLHMASEMAKTSIHSTGARLRTNPGPRDSEVLAYPSTEGVVIGQLLGVELDWLGIPPASPALLQPSGDQDGEDEFALKLMHIGGRWWPSLKFHALQGLTSCPYGYHYPPDLHFPDSLGVGDRLPEDTLERPEDWSRLAACRTMEERWAVLKDFGATEYDDVKMCPDIPDSLAAGVVEGRRYEELLKKMQGDDYRAIWLDELWRRRD